MSPDHWSRPESTVGGCATNFIYSLQLKDLVLQLHFSADPSSVMGTGARWLGGSDATPTMRERRRVERHWAAAGVRSRRGSPGRRAGRAGDGVCGTPFVPFALSLRGGLCAHRREEGEGQHGERDVAKPAVPAARLAMIEPDFAFAGLEAFLDGPALTRDTREIAQR